MTLMLTMFSTFNVLVPSLVQKENNKVQPSVSSVFASFLTPYYYFFVIPCRHSHLFVILHLLLSLML